MIIISKFFYPKHNCNLIRLGNTNDGGYVVEENSIKNSEILLSFGLSDDWSFESDFSNLGKKKIYTYDYSVNARFWIINFIKTLINILFFKELSSNIKKLFQYFKYKFFFNNNNNFHYKKFISPSSMKKNMLRDNFIIDVNDIMKKIDKKIFLKIDIEGSEYRILDQIVNNAKKMNGLVIEFHNFDLHQEIIKSFIQDFELELVHIHVNNYGTIDKAGVPSVVELTFSSEEFIINDLINDKAYPLENLDNPCNKNDFDHKIKFN
jgi:hypothetical protein